MSGKYAIITPYFKESRDELERCIGSVEAQTVKADHFLVADGFPQSWLADRAVRHIALDKAHGDFGNTARGIGALLAIAEQYDGIGLLDADNWLEKKHVETCVTAARSSPEPIDFVIAKRRFVRSDGSELSCPDEVSHVDTSCLFFLRGSFFALPFWASMPRELSPCGDRIFWHMLQSRGALRSVRTPETTVNYHTMWEIHYRYQGETPPVGAKPIINSTEIYEWIESLDARDLEIVERLTGARLSSRSRYEG